MKAALPARSASGWRSTTEASFKAGVQYHVWKEHARREGGCLYEQDDLSHVGGGMQSIDASRGEPYWVCLQVIAAVGCLARIPLPQGALRPIRVKRGGQPAPARQRAAQPQPLSGRPGDSLLPCYLQSHVPPVHGGKYLVSTDAIEGKGW